MGPGSAGYLEHKQLNGALLNQPLRKGPLRKSVRSAVSLMLPALSFPFLSSAEMKNLLVSCKRAQCVWIKHVYPFNYFDSLGGHVTKAGIFGEAVMESSLFLIIFMPYIN